MIERDKEGWDAYVDGAKHAEESRAILWAADRIAQLEARLAAVNLAVLEAGVNMNSGIGPKVKIRQQDWNALLVALELAPPTDPPQQGVADDK